MIDIYDLHTSLSLLGFVDEHSELRWELIGMILNRSVTRETKLTVEDETRVFAAVKHLTRLWGRDDGGEVIEFTKKMIENHRNGFYSRSNPFEFRRELDRYWSVRTLGIMPF